ncbi:beta strand repeat-containing protein [Mucilaginibacter pocheonensis]|uniref:Secretion system C-terminal sorting domain-containing protein n=1 Tax=Mucilaginibacter pocheonensis TaxID=398050 RepID=A0ABU1TIE4_9SPHI|nr:T9SS type A sorting domain-containing protein [Mucilaginibacter pocheonensis]MDR6944610.1 hypothetical protein [Mucilaginibacter pocheonensis]
MFIHSRSFAVYTFNWNGLTSTSWTTTANWTVTGTSPDGTLANFPGSNGRTSDIVQFGVTGLSYTNQPVLSSNVTVASITFGSIQYKSSYVLAGTTITGTILTVTGVTLTVLGDITQNYNSNSVSGSSIFNDIRGTGTITCDNLQFGNTSGTTTNLSFLILEAANFTVATNVNMNLNAKVQNGSGVRLENGTMTIGGQITFTNRGSTSPNSCYFTVNARTSYKTSNTITNPTLILNGTNAIGTMPLPYASCNFYGDRAPGGKATVNYKGANPIIYTTSTVGFGSGGGVVNSNAATDPTYDNLIIQGSGTAVIGGTTAGSTSYLNIDSTFTTYSDVSFSNATNTATKVGATSSTAATWTNNSTATITGGSGTIDVNGTLSNAGTMTMGTGALSIAKDYTNTGTFTPNATPTITFDGTTQTLTDATATGTNFYNVAFSGGGTKSMASGSKFTVAPLYTLSVTGSSTLAVGSNSSTTALTLLSTLSGDASIGTLAAGTITGNINVQRYVKGTLRRYMLLSSPVTNTSTAFTNGTISTYNLVPLFATTYITGPGGSTNGFDDAASTGNSPSVFVYDENAPLTTDVNQIVGNEYKAFSSTAQGVPPANGFLYYFRGSRSVSNPFVKPFPATDNATLNFFGTVIKGTGATNASFNANIINFPATVPTYYTATAVSAPQTLSYASTASTKKGLNLIGNPYASVIDLHALYLANTSNKFYYMLVKDASTGTNSSSTKFALYDANLNSAGTGASRYALSGQGFFTLATSASAITFNESMKVAYSLYSAAPSSIPVFNVANPNNHLAAAKMAVNPHGGNIQQTLATAAASTNADADAIPRLRLELAKDSIIHNSTDINFDKTANGKFVQGEDAPYYQPSGQGDLLYSLTADSIGCFANYTTDLEKLKRINLIVTFSNYGLYKITSPFKQNIDERYSIFLKDKFTNDSLDVVHNQEYSFNVTTDKASYAHDRFYLSIGIAPGHAYKLLSFSGTKVTTGVQLTWKTDNESNFTGFVIEKSLDGGKSFSAIDSLQSSAKGSYSFTNPTAGSGQITYRLIQKLVTGSIDTSKNLAFNYLTTNLLRFMVYPSNATQNININFGKTYNSRVQINIVSSAGGLIKTIRTNNTDSIQQDVGNLLKGIYVVEAIDETTGKRIGSAKFFKQ